MGHEPCLLPATGSGKKDYRQRPAPFPGGKGSLRGWVPGSVQDLPDRWFGSGTETGRGSWEARPPGVKPQWGGSNTNEATASQLRLRPLSDTWVGHKHRQLELGTGWHSRLRHGKGAGSAPGSLQGTGPKPLQEHCRGRAMWPGTEAVWGWARLTHTILSYLAKAHVFKVQRLDQ